MPISIWDFIVIGMAAAAAVSAWMHEGGLFADIRDRIDVWGTPDDAADESLETWFRRLRRWVRVKIGELLNCAFCLTFHTAFWLLVGLYCAQQFLAPPWNDVAVLPIYALAIAKLAHLIQRIEK
jgi:hypothetical protein